MPRERPWVEPVRYHPAMVTHSPNWFLVGEDGTEEVLLSRASHGDILVRPGSRSGGVHFVCARDEGGSECPKELVKKDETGSGYCSVPLPITRHFEDPVGVYLPLLVHSRAGIRLSDWRSIELDPVVHAGVLGTVTGQGPIGAGRRVVYFVSGEEVSGYAIWNPDLPGESSRAWRKLNRRTPRNYLGAEVHYLTEAELTRIQRKNSEEHTTKLLQWLRTCAAGDNLDTLSIPSNINHREGSVTHGSSVTFIGLEGDGDRCSVRTVLREYTDWDQQTGARNVRDLEVLFEPEALAETGPWGHVTFWVNRALGRYLVPPPSRSK